MSVSLPPEPVGFPLTITSRSTVTVELFQDVCCPFSKVMFNTVNNLLIPLLRDRVAANKIAFVWQSVPQPWHAQSCLMHDVLMAAYLVDKTNISSYLRCMFAQQENFFDDATKNLSRIEIYNRLAAIGDQCGYESKEIKAKLDMDKVEGNSGLGDVTQKLKWAVKYHRGRGVHVTPTVFINGLEATDVSSGSSSEDWMRMLTKMLD